MYSGKYKTTAGGQVIYTLAYIILHILDRAHTQDPLGIYCTSPKSYVFAKFSF